jgi:hypothetical protein
LRILLGNQVVGSLARCLMVLIGEVALHCGCSSPGSKLQCFVALLVANQMGDVQRVGEIV